MSHVKQQPTVSAAPPGERSVGWLRPVLFNQQFLLLVALAVLVIYFTARDSVFLSSSEIVVLLTNYSTLVLLAVGETFVIISGGIDLSVGATCGVASVLAAFAMRGMVSSNDNEALVLLVGTLVSAAVGVGIGFLNAALMNWARLVPFVATLATLGAGTGVALVLSNGVPIGDDSSALTIGSDHIGPFPYMFLVVLVLVIIAWLYLHLSRFGRYTFAIGSNTFAARAAGINVRRHLTSVYVLSGLLAGLTGMVFYIRLGSGAPSSGDGFELTAIASVVIGGVSLFGGSGRLTGTVLGALILTVVTSGLIIINVSPNWNQVAVAICIAAAASLQALRALANPRRRS
jgi:ribose transport system permease protein